MLETSASAALANDQANVTVTHASLNVVSGGAAPELATFADEEREHNDSDVYVCHRVTSHDGHEREHHEDAQVEPAPVVQGVTLYVYGWHNVQPGPLSWVFPSLRTALDAVRTMRNAVQWCIVSGEWPSVDLARARGAVLIEQLG